MPWAGATTTAAALLLLLASSTHAFTTTYPESKSKATLFGTYPDPKQPGLFSVFNRWLGSKAQSVKVLEFGWSHLSAIPGQLQQLYDTWEVDQAIPVITWMPYPYKKWASPTPNEDIYNGLYDGYIDAFYLGLSEFLAGKDGRLGTSDDRRVYLRLAPAPNGNWFPWSPTCPSCASTGQHINQTVASYITMFHYVIDKGRVNFNFPRSVIQIVWQVSAADAYGAGYTMEQFYPGNFYVDWMGIEGFNWGTTIPGNSWISAAEVFQTGLARLEKLNDDAPYALLTVASTSVPNGTLAKDQWMKGVFDLAAGWTISATSCVCLVTYHNADGATDFGAFGGANGLESWSDPTQPTAPPYMVYNGLRDGLTMNAWMVGSNATLHPRLVSDEVFWGQC